MRSKLAKVVLMLALFGLLVPTTGCRLNRLLGGSGYGGSDYYDDGFGFDFDFDLGSLFYDDDCCYDDDYYDDYGYDGFDDYYYDDGFGYDDWFYWKGKKPGKTK